MAGGRHHAVGARRPDLDDDRAPLRPAEEGHDRAGDGRRPRHLRPGDAVRVLDPHVAHERRLRPVRGRVLDRQRAARRTAAGRWSTTAARSAPRRATGASCRARWGRRPPSRRECRPGHRRSEGARRADRRPRRRPPRLLDRRVGQGARRWCAAKLEELPVEIETDEAGNVWADLPGEQDGFVIVGSHVDSVPAGGWLDGALGLFAAARGPAPARRRRPPDRAALRRLGRRGGRALRPQPVRLLGLRRHARRRRGPRPQGPRGRAARGRRRPPRRRSREGARVRRAPEGRARLPRAAHRAGPGARGARRAGRGRAGDGRGRAPCRRVQRPRGPRGRDADGHAAGLVPGRGARGAADPARSGSPTRAATAPPAARPATRAW